MTVARGAASFGEKTGRIRITTGNNSIKDRLVEERTQYLLAHREADHHGSLGGQKVDLVSAADKDDLVFLEQKFMDEALPRWSQFILVFVERGLAIARPPIGPLIGPRANRKGVLLTGRGEDLEGHACRAWIIRPADRRKGELFSLGHEYKFLHRAAPLVEPQLDRIHAYPVVSEYGGGGDYN